MTTAAVPTKPDALDVLFGQDQHHRWVARFSVRGREYVMAPPAGTTLDARGALIPVWNAKHRRIMLRVHPTDTVQVLTRQLAGGEEVAEQ